MATNFKIMSNIRTVKNIDGIVKTFTTDGDFLDYVRCIYKENEEDQPYQSEIHWLPENIQQATEYIVEYCPGLDDDKLDVNELEIGDLDDMIEETVQEFDKDNPTCAGFNYNDILTQAEQDDVELTEEEAKDVVRLMINQAEIPVGWDDVSYFIEHFKNFDL